MTTNDDITVLPKSVTEVQLSDACMFFRHDYGLMDAEEQEHLRWEAKEWLLAWQKALDIV